MSGSGSGAPPWVELLAARADGLQWDHDARMAPPRDGSGRPAAVLVLLGAGTTGAAGASGQVPAGLAVVLLERASTLRRHAGQVAFPGGAADRQDTDAAATALREAAEEVGLDPGSAQVVATLPELYVPPSGYVVTPVIAYWTAPHPLQVLDAGEVASVHRVPVARLVDPVARWTVRGGAGYVGPAFEVAGLFVWGFTALVLDRVLDLGGWTRPWDRERRRDIPGPLRSEPAPGVVGRSD